MVQLFTITALSASKDFPWLVIASVEVDNITPFALT